MRFSVIVEQIQNECESHLCAFPTPFKPTQEGALSHPDWLGGKRPKLPPLLNQESTALCTGDLNPLQLVWRGLLEKQPKTKKRKKANLEQLDRYNMSKTHNDMSKMLLFPKNGCIFRNVVALSCFSPSVILNFSSNQRVDSSYTALSPLLFRDIKLLHCTSGLHLCAQRGILQHVRAYEKTLDITYAQEEGISALLEAAGRSLRRGGRVCYLGWGSLAVTGLIDASECIPTFGADYNDVRGFISGGYRELNNSEGPLISLGPDFCIAHEDFLRLALPSLSDLDAVLLVYTHSDDVGDVVKLARRVREQTSNLHAVYHQVDGDTAAAVQQNDINKLCLSSLRITWPSPASRSLLHMQWELSTKLLLNAVSTGAHVLKGKIYQNHMIDVQVTNSKLYGRATRLLRKLSGCPEPQCEEALLKAIYRVDELTADITSSDMNTHTLAARSRTKVVPLALVCLLTGRSLQEAETHLERQPVVREAVEACLSPSTRRTVTAAHPRT
ncbi:glucokinase regulatory protein isoform 2-T2 [Acanthopagrus schlegelii]